MTLGVKLNTYIEQLGEKQAAVATAWLERWNSRGGNRTWSDSTIISHLNRLVNDQEQGLRFFFQDRTRGALLLEVLQVPEAEHPALFGLAEQALKSEGAPARIIIDATGWTLGLEKADALFAELKRLLIMEGPYPITLIILEDQYDKLPRSFDPLMDKEKLRRHEVKTPEQGWERTQELAEEQGLVLSARRFPEFERWLAADFDGRTLRIEPTNGLELFRTQGRLPSLEPVTHDLSKLVERKGLPGGVRLPSSSCELHQLMRALRSEEASARLQRDMAVRQQLAVTLGITATSTSRERTEAQVGALQRELPVKLTQGSAADLETRLTQARRRSTGPLALWVEDAVHLLNVPEAARLAENRPWVRTHDIQPDPTPLSLLLKAVADWSVFDFLSDPFLEHLIARLDPEAKQRTAFLHARAGLLLTQALQPKARAPVADWKPILAEMLANEPPAALLRVHLQGNKIHYAGKERLPFPITQARVEQVEKARSQALQQVPPVGDLLLSRQDALLVVAGKKVERLGGYYPTAPSILLPDTPDSARDSEFWLDVYEACDFTTDSWHKRAPAIWDRKSALLIPGRLTGWVMGSFAIAPEVWEEADRELAMAWLALRMALSNPQTIRLPDGAMLLRLGGPFFAELRITPTSNRTDLKPIQASLLFDIDFSELRNNPNNTREALGQAPGLSDLVTTHTVKGGYDFGARLPKRIHLMGERYCADIRFRGSALFSEASQFLPYASAVARIEDEKQKAAAAQDDDDD